LLGIGYIGHSRFAISSRHFQTVTIRHGFISFCFGKITIENGTTVSNARTTVRACNPDSLNQQRCAGASSDITA
jgi:hypothetical protein